MITSSDSAPSRRNTAGRNTLRQFLVLFAVGFIGVVSLIPGLVPVIENLLAVTPDAPDLPRWSLVLLSMVNPSLLLALGTILGVSLAWRVGLRSHLANWAAGGNSAWQAIREEAPPAIVGGVIAAVILVYGNIVSLPLLGQYAVELDITSGRTPYATLMGILYGGMTEELQLRWGVMTLLVALLWLPGRKLPRPTVEGDPSRRQPSSIVMWIAIALSALIFGALHLPAVAGVVDALTMPVILRTVILNALVGVIFGWFYWRRSLESAMIAHASTHVAITVITLVMYH